MTTWQDIATAPRDGTGFDVWTLEDGRHTNVHWSDGNFVEPVFDEGIICAYVLVKDCTHWMPLPEPPK